MARKLRLLFEGALYHVTFRGNARQDVFADDQDRLRLLERLCESAENFAVTVHAYCLMSNHVHLLVGTPQGNLDRFMGSLLTGYTLYFNRRHGRVGHLMQGRYGAQVVEGDEYLYRLSRYIHLNPVKVAECADLPIEELSVRLLAYQWSSLRAYMGLAKPIVCLSQRSLLELVGPGEDSFMAYRKFVEDGLARTDDELVELRRASPLAIGSPAFLEDQARRHFQRMVSIKREDVSLRGVKVRASKEEIFAAVLKVCGCDPMELNRPRDGALFRHVLAWCLRRHGGFSQREIAKSLGVTTGAAVSILLKRKFPAADKFKAHLDLTFKG